jgi:hypothetical protein
VEQVALNRHVFKCDCKIVTLAATPAASFMREKGAEVNRNVRSSSDAITQSWFVGARHRCALLGNFEAVSST